eukprot:TRINITY_DN62923_c0_g1_i1.p1 TRINITY_DN62923_c0_g1~~TRINITY_DN62923_c0_g1_i1.p1  ORF type:complete len:346 (+),score=59.53 TRINITY_DN62923_c0_g1_i1:58-1095(+)
MAPKNVPKKETTGTVTGDCKELLQPLIDCFQTARETMSKELNKDPAPEFTCEQVEDTTKWLHCIVRAMKEHNNGFSKLGLSGLSEEALEHNQELAREASRQLTLLFADQTKEFSGDNSKYQISEFGKGSQSQEIKDNLQKFTAFLKHFGDKKWLGELVAPEFEEQKNNAVSLLEALQNPTKLVLPGCAADQPAVHCSRCGQTATRTLGFCTNCNQCAHGYRRNQCPQGCPSGCNTGANQAGAGYCGRCRCTTTKSLGYCTSCNYCNHGYRRNQYPQGCPSGCNQPQPHIIEILQTQPSLFDIFPRLNSVAQRSYSDWRRWLLRWLRPVVKMLLPGHRQKRSWTRR